VNASSTYSPEKILGKDRTSPQAAGPEFVRRLREQMGLDLRFVEYCRGASEVGGPCRVTDRSGKAFILAAVPGDEESRACHARSLNVLERLWAGGHPVPHYERVVDLGDSLAILEQEMPGMVPRRITRSLVDRLLELQNDRASVMGEHSDAGPLSLGLRDGPNHSILRQYSERTSRLIEWIEDVGARYGDDLAGPDAVHFDYHPGNVLVDADRPNEVTAIVDWGGAVASAGGFDLVTLAWTIPTNDLEREPGVDKYLWTVVRQLPQPILMQSWAHMSLRLMVWCVRFHPELLGHWLDVSERLAREAGGS
jgi:hypothetical protein